MDTRFSSQPPFVSAMMCGVFLLIIWLPIGGAILGIEQGGTASEKRKAAPLPRWEWSQKKASTYPKRFEKWYRDSFGFRRLLIMSHNSLKFYCLGIPPSHMVMKGKNGWLFLRWNMIINNFQSFYPFTPGVLETWATTLQERKDWLESHGIKFAFVVPPDKGTLYPEFMPDAYPRKDGPKALDEFFTYMRRHTNVNIIDVRDALWHTKKSGTQVYYQLDTHWNRVGAFQGYRAIMEALSPLFPGLPLLDNENTTVITDNSRSKDLVRFMNLFSPLTEPEIRVRRIPNSLVKELKAKGPIGKSIRKHSWKAEWKGTGEPNGGSMILIGDSYSNNLKKFFYETFGRVTHLTRLKGHVSTVDEALGEFILEEQPDVVLFEMVERNIRLFPTSISPVIEPVALATPQRLAITAQRLMQ